VKAKCRPEGISLTPRKRGVVVKERRSMPARAEGGRSRRRRAGLLADSMRRCCDVLMDDLVLGLQRAC
jgi:hypothetical protein